jgi:hypothetical protein
MDAGMVAGEVAPRIGQGPVVVQRAADTTPGHPQDYAGERAKCLPLAADDFKAQGHDLTEPFAVDPEL